MLQPRAVVHPAVMCVQEYMSRPLRWFSVKLFVNPKCCFLLVVDATMCWCNWLGPAHGAECLSISGQVTRSAGPLPGLGTSLCSNPPSHGAASQQLLTGAELGLGRAPALPLLLLF